MRQEIQIKTRHFVPYEELVRLGAEWIGDSENQNIFLGNSTPESIHRIRIVEETIHYSQKGKNNGDFARIKPVEERQISIPEAKALMKRHGILEKVDISSRNFRLRKCILSCDQVKALGFFLEICGTSSEADIDEVLEMLGIDRSECTNESYFDLMVGSDIPKWRKILLRANNTITDLTFGVTSGLMTAVGILIGVYSANPSKLFVASALLALAISDSPSEAFAMYNSKISEGSSPAMAMKYALCAMSGNIIIPLVFLLPLFFLTLSATVSFNLILAAVILITLSTAHSLANQESVFKNVSKNLLLAVGIVVAAHLAGNFVAWAFSQFKLG